MQFNIEILAEQRPHFGDVVDLYLRRLHSSPPLRRLHLWLPLTHDWPDFFDDYIRDRVDWSRGWRRP